MVPIQRKRPALVLATASLCLPLAVALIAHADGEAPAADAELTIPFKKMKLDNGLELILHEDHARPFVAVSVWYHVGAFQEAPGKTGFAHLFEHLMFQGTPHVGEDNHIKYLESVGASIRGGMVNGTTNLDRTNYFEVIPRNELELALWLESDRMGWLMQGMTQAKLDEQRGVVTQERLQGTENAPYGLAEERLWQSVFPKDHPYYGAVIGSIADLNAATLEDVGGFYDAYYAPSNATLCIAGDFEEAAAIELAKKYFGTLPPWEKPVPRDVKVPEPKPDIRVDHDEKIGKLPYIQLMWLTPGFFAPGDADLDVLAYTLTTGKSSTLWRRLVEEEQVAQSVRASQGSNGQVSVFTIDVMLKEGKDPDAVIATIQSQLEELVDLPPEAKEIARAINTIETARLFGLQNVGGFSGRAELLQAYNHFRGDPGGLAWDLARYRAVTPESLGNVVKTHLTRERRAVLVARPAAAAPPSDKQPAAAAGGQ